MCRTTIKLISQLQMDNEKIIQKLESISINPVDGEMSSFHFPLRKRKDLKNFEVELQDKNIYNSFVRWIKQQGGFDVPHFLLNIARNVFDDKLLKQYSLCGRKGKFCFKDFKNVIQAHVDGINGTPNFEVTILDVKTFYSRYLKNAPGRLSMVRRRPSFYFTILIHFFLFQREHKKSLLES